jgi:hypothetical protein
MPEPPKADRRRHNQQPEHLVAPEDACLLLARGLLVLLLFVRLDSGVNHSGSRKLLVRRIAGASRLSIGECKLIKFEDAPVDFPRPHSR